MRGKSIRLLQPGSFLKRMISGISGRTDALSLLQHELRTPLTGILGMAALLRNSTLNCEQLQLLTALEQSGRQLADLLDHHGAWLKTGTVRVPVNATTFNGLHLLENVVRAHWPAARGRGLGIFLIFDHRLPAYWRTDPTLLREALDNLLANAIKFTPSGHVLLEARRFGGDGSAREKLELRVSDTGVGIPCRDARRIYSLGERGSEDRVRQYSGSGYGLFICNRIVAALGGSLNHGPSRSGGTCFTMRMPGSALAVPGATERLRPRLLRGLSCQVSLPPPLDRAVAHALRRMGIAVSFQKREAGEDWPQHFDARIMNSHPRGSGVRGENADFMEFPVDRFPWVDCHPILQGRPGSDSAGAFGTRLQQVSSVLHQPVFHTNLEPLMLQLALHLRMNFSDKPDSGCGRR